MFKLQFPADEIDRWASRYYAQYEPPFRMLEWEVHVESSLNVPQLELVAKWKSPLATQDVAQNDDAFVREVTRVAFATPNERLRIDVLTLLRGVGYPLASVLLHWFHSDPYPILGVQQLAALGVAVPDEYTFEFWWSYVRACRALTEQHDVDMRTLDRALWQWSKENGAE